MIKLIFIPGIDLLDAHLDFTDTPNGLISARAQIFRPHARAIETKAQLIELTLNFCEISSNISPACDQRIQRN